jgi:hypothetical protein
MAYVSQPIRDMLFIPPAWKGRQAKRNGPMFAYDGMSPLDSRKARDAEPVAQPGNGDAVQAIREWCLQNLSEEEIVELIDQLTKMGQTSTSSNQQMGMQEAETEDEPPEFYGKPSPGGQLNTSTPRRDPQQGAPARSGGFPADKRQPAMDMAFDDFDKLFPDGKRIGLREKGWPANQSQRAMAFDQQSVAAFEKMFPTHIRT